MCIRLFFLSPFLGSFNHLAVFFYVFTICACLRLNFLQNTRCQNSNRKWPNLQHSHPIIFYYCISKKIKSITADEYRKTTSKKKSIEDRSANSMRSADTDKLTWKKKTKYKVSKKNPKLNKYYSHTNEIKAHKQFRTEWTKKFTARMRHTEIYTRTYIVYAMHTCTPYCVNNEHTQPHKVNLKAKKIK